MSDTNPEVARIRAAVLDVLSGREWPVTSNHVYSAAFMASTNLSTQAITRVVRGLVNEGLIVRSGAGFSLAALASL